MTEMLRLSGLREFRAGLRRMDRQLPKEIAKAGRRAGQIVVNAARPRVPVGPDIGGHAASSIKTRSTQKGVSVTEGGGRFSYLPWLDFGGRIQPRQEIRRPYLRQGRYIWAAFADHKEQVQDTYLDALYDVARNAGLHPERFR